MTCTVTEREEMLYLLVCRRILLVLEGYCTNTHTMLKRETRGYHQVVLCKLEPLMSIFEEKKLFSNDENGRESATTR